MKKFSRRLALKFSAILGATTLLGSSHASNKQIKKAKIDYSLQKDITNLNIPKTITVVGTGGYGSWVAFYAALAGVKNMILIDAGKVDGKDLARGPFHQNSVGMSKSDSIKQAILDLRSDVEIKTYEKWFTTDDVKMLQGHVFNGASDQTLQEQLPLLCKENGHNYNGGVYSGNAVCVYNSHPKNLKIAKEEEPKVWVGSASLSALLSVISAFGKSFEYAGEISDIAMNSAQISSAIEIIGSTNP